MNSSSWRKETIERFFAGAKKPWPPLRPLARNQEHAGAVFSERRGAKHEMSGKSRIMAYFFVFLCFKQHKPPASGE